MTNGSGSLYAEQRILAFFLFILPYGLNFVVGGPKAVRGLPQATPANPHGVVHSGRLQ